VKDVADNRDLQAFESFLVAQNRVSVKQRLGGMFVQSISGVDHGHVDMLRHHERRAGVGVADDDDVGAYRAHRVSGVEQRFAFLNTRTGGLDEDGVSAQCLGRDFKRASGAGGGLVKNEKHPLALEQGPRLVRIHAPGKLQQFQDLGCFQVLDTEQGTARWIHSCLTVRGASAIRIGACLQACRGCSVMRAPSDAEALDWSFTTPNLSAAFPSAGLSPRHRPREV
jgi:hypothetical protein